jgi:hypothetical protein
MGLRAEDAADIAMICLSVRFKTELLGTVEPLNGLQRSPSVVPPM